MEQLEQHISVGCEIAHLVEQLLSMQSVIGSNPIFDTKRKDCSGWMK